MANVETGLISLDVSGNHIEDQKPMRCLPVTYPSKDDVAYLAHFESRFPHVFVALNPFIQLFGFPSEQYGAELPEAAENRAKRLGPRCGRSWQCVAELSGLSSVRSVNRALRLTGSGRIKAELSNPAETESLVDACRGGHLFLPLEGTWSPVFELQAAAFLSALDHKEVWSARSIGVEPSTISVGDLADTELQSNPEIYALDGSVYMTIYPDYHYVLVCQSRGSFERADPQKFFEGFHATSNTTDFWGIGSHAEAHTNR
ncbi:MAG: hypothetical protein AAF441_00375 [Pseudomonadota bacterium]